MARPSASLLALFEGEGDLEGDCERGAAARGLPLSVACVSSSATLRSVLPPICCGHPSWPLDPSRGGLAQSGRRRCWDGEGAEARLASGADVPASEGAALMTLSS